MADNAPTELINYLPTEIIERLVPDWRPETISALRLVNKRLCEVFSADHYYRSYLHYPDRIEHYRHDLEEIGEGKGKWRRVLELEKRRLANWRNGRITSVETVNIPSDLSPAENRSIISALTFRETQYEWQAQTDESDEHWMLCECNDRKIILLNLTYKPIMSVHDVSAFTTMQVGFATLLPGQLLIRGDMLHVFKIDKIGDTFSLKYLFEIEERYDSGFFISGKSNVNGTYKNLYITYLCYPTDGILKVWDLKGAVKMESIFLIELIMQKCAIDFNNVRPCLEVSKAEFPNVLVMLTFKQDGYVHQAIAMVNVEETQLVHCFGEIYPLDLEYCIFKGHTACMLLDLRRGNTHASKEAVVVYDLRKRPTLEADQPSILFQFESGQCLDVHYEHSTLIMNEKFLNKVHIVCLDGPGVSHRKIRLNAKENFCISCIIEPFFVVKHCDKDGSVLTSFDMFGKSMFDWAQVLSERGIVEVMENLSIVEQADFQSLSKCVLKNRKGDNLHICYF